jgi:hypothetical protein
VAEGAGPIMATGLRLSVTMLHAPAQKRPALCISPCWQASASHRDRFRRTAFTTTNEAVDKNALFASHQSNYGRHFKGLLAGFESPVPERSKKGEFLCVSAGYVSLWLFGGAGVSDCAPGLTDGSRLVSRDDDGRGSPTAGLGALIVLRMSAWGKLRLRRSRAPCAARSSGAAGGCRSSVWWR